MCGISGVFSFKNPKFREYDDARDFLQQAMFVGTVRGFDSTGLLTVTRKKGEAEYVKQAIDGCSFLGNRAVQHKFKKFDDYSVAIVHNRKASHGMITDSNAHPFTVGHITLVHNGGILLHRRLPGGTGIDVDSEAIAAAFNTVSPSKAKNILSLLDGSFVLFWHDDRDGSVNLARNDKRPLTMAYHEKEDMLYFCSEKKMLDWLLDRCGINHTAMFDPKPNQHFKWVINNNEVKNFDVKKFEPYKSPVYSGGNNWNGNQSNVSNIRPPYNDDVIPTLDSLGLTSGQKVIFEKYEVCSVNVNANRCTIKGMSVDFNFETIAYNVTETYVREGDLFTANVSSINQRLSSAGWACVTLTAVGVASDEEVKKWKESFSGGAAKKSCTKGCDEICPECRKDVEKGGVGSEKKQVHETPMAQLLAETADDYYADATAYVQGPNGILIQQKEYDELTKHGCSNCSADLLSPSETHWTYNEDPLCRGCDAVIGSILENYSGRVQ